VKISNEILLNLENCNKVRQAKAVPVLNQASHHKDLSIA